MLLSDQINVWEKNVLPFIRSQDMNVLFEISERLDSETKLRQTKTTIDTSLVEVNAEQFSKNLFLQGHVSNLILLYAMAGKPFENRRRELTKYLIDFTVTSFTPCLTDRKWTTSVFTNKINVQILAATMQLWSRSDPKELPKYFQNFIPLFLLFGDYKTVPVKRRPLEIAYQTLIAGTCKIESKTWRDVAADSSISIVMFHSIVKEANKLLMVPEKMIKIGNHTATIFSDNLSSQENEKKIIEVCNWLSFGAYITLLSKYARYNLSINEQCDTQKSIMEERTKILGFIQSALK